MALNTFFDHTEPELLGILEELRRREPIFHTPAFGTTPAERASSMAADYWEVGASGRRYSRDFILEALADSHFVDAAKLGWQLTDHAVRRLGLDTYLMTYVLRQGERLSRRATIWQSTEDGWQVLYHQGTIVAAEEDDTAPKQGSLI